MHYGNRLKWLIKNKGFFQKDIAAALNVPENTLSDWTAKEFPPLERIEAVCSVLQIPVSRFFIDPDNDLSIEPTARESELLRIFNDFSEEQQEKVLRMLELMKEF